MEPSKVFLNFRRIGEDFLGKCSTLGYNLTLSTGDNGWVQ